MLVQFTLPFLLLTYFLSGCALFLAFQRWIRFPEALLPRLFWLSLGAGPVVISWIVITAMQLAPDLPHFAYVCMVEGALLALVIAGWPARTALATVLSDFAGAARSMRAWTGLELVVLGLLLAMFAATVFFAVLLPVTENDAIQYALVSRMIYDHGSLGIYPVIEPDPRSGFYAVSSHPLGFMGLYLWTYMAQGDAARLGLIKLVSPLFVFYTLLALAAIHWYRARLITLAAGLLLLTTPVWFIQSSLLSIDSFRIYLLLAAAAWMVETAERGARYPALKWVAAVFCGLSMFSHSINLVLTLPVLGAGYLFVAHGSLAERLRVLIAIGLCATLVGGERIVSNLLQFGLPVYDFLPVYDLPFLHHKAHVWGEAGMIDMGDRVVDGVLRGWSDLRSFGITYWIALLAMIAWLLRWPQPGGPGPMETMQLAVVASLVVLAAVTVAIGSPAFVTNARYIMTGQPFVASIGAIFLVAAYERYRTAA